MTDEKKEPKKVSTSITPLNGDLPVRYHLPDERPGRTVKFLIDECEGYFTVGLFEDGSPGELFIKLSKNDVKFSGFAEMWAISVSLLFQYGVPHEKIYNKFMFQDFPPHGLTRLPEIPMCKSIVDFIMKYLEMHFPPTKQENKDDYDRMLEG